MRMTSAEYRSAVVMLLNVLDVQKVHVFIKMEVSDESNK
jgi:hypothetical protein